MHYYFHHIGDFVKATSRLTDSQSMAYLRLIWLYYEQEKPLENDTKLLAFQIGSDEQTIDLILRSYFKLEGNSWHQTRCDELIEAYQKQSSGGKKGAKNRWDKEKLKGIDSHPIATPLGEVMPSLIATNNQEPITNNHKPITKENLSLSESKIPTCPHKEILGLWKKNLPQLTQPRSWEGNRQQTLKQRWIQASKKSSYSDGYNTSDEGLNWWNDFFEYIAKGTKLANGFETEGRVWKPDLEWVLTPKNFQKIIDGKYNK